MKKTALLILGALLYLTLTSCAVLENGSVAVVV